MQNTQKNKSKYTIWKTFGPKKSPKSLNIFVFDLSTHPSLYKRDLDLRWLYFIFYLKGRFLHSKFHNHLKYIKCRDECLFHFWGWMYFHGFLHRVSIERKCPYKKKLKGAWVSPLYFDNNDVTYKWMPNLSF